MADQTEIRNTLEKLKEVATGGFALAFHIRYTTPAFLFQTYSKDWLDHYSNNGFVLSDPTVAWGLQNTGATRWSDLGDSDQSGVLVKAAEFGLNFGTTCAIEDGDSRSICSFSRADREFTATETVLLLESSETLHRATSDLKTLSPETNKKLRMMSVQYTHS